MKVLLTRVLPCVLVCALAVDAAAQDQAADTGTRTGSLSMQVGAGAIVDKAPDGTKNVGKSLNAGLGHTWALKRGAIVFAGNASQYLYGGAAQDLNTLTYAGSASFGYSITPRLTMSFGDQLSKGFARQLMTIVPLAGQSLPPIDARLANPTTLTTTNSTGGTMSYVISPRSDMQASVQYSAIGYDLDQPSEVDQAILAKNSTLSYRVGVQRQITRDDAIGVAQDYSRNINSGDNATTFGIRATWRRPIGENYSLSAEGGVNGYSLTRLQGTSYAPTMSMTIARRLQAMSGSTLALRVERYVEVLGSNTHVSEVFSPSYGFTVLRRLNLSFDGTYARNTFPVEKKYNYRALIGTATARYQLPANIVVMGSYSNWDRKLTNQLDPPPDKTYYSTIAVTYGRAWR